jgi:hypothetical protein
MMSERQYLYIFSNPSMPGLLKIGCTTRAPHERRLELHTTGVPTAFDIEYACEVADCWACEQAAHRALDRYRIVPNREFFKVSIKTAIKKIQAVIGPYREIEPGGDGGNGAARAARNRSSSTKKSTTGKTLPPKTVVAPAAWPFPCSSTPAKAKKAPAEPASKTSKAKSKPAPKKTVVAPAAWPFPPSSRP